MLLSLYTQATGIKDVGIIKTYSVIGLMATDQAFPEGQFIHLDLIDYPKAIIMGENVGKEYRGLGLSGVLMQARWDFKRQEEKGIGLQQAFEIMGVQL